MNNNKKKILQSCFKDVLKINNFENIDNLNRDELKNWDSLNHVRLILKIEKAFSIKISPNDQEKLISFKLLEEFLAQN